MQRQSKIIHVADFSLDHTLDSGQAFRWRRAADGGWNGVIGRQFVCLRQQGDRITIAADDPEEVARYFQWHVDLRAITNTFPGDAHLAAAVQACWGLRILKQHPWECLASFIASSTKQIVQIKQIVELLSRTLGEEIPVGARHAVPVHAFPTVEAVASSTHDTLWNCKLGFRAKYLLATARAIAEGKPDLSRIDSMCYDEALGSLCELPGVGEKVANCVLLFAYGKQQAFPIDVWIERGLRQLYFHRKPNAPSKQLRKFTQTYFGPNAGYAQQYLFHYVRTRVRDRTPRNT